MTRFCRYQLVLGLLLAGGTVAGCKRSEPSPPGSPGQPAAAARPVVYAVNYPLQYFAARIAGDAAEVLCPAPPGADPAFWRPDDGTIAAFQQADLILLNGAGYARWVQQATLPMSKLVDTSSAFADRTIEIEGAVKHAHGPQGAHAHGGVAFTTWLDPTLALQQVAATHDALARLLLGQAAALKANYDALQRDLQALDGRFEQLAAGYAGQPVLSSHPVYQYFARRYGLNLRSVHWEPHDVPDAAQWAELDDLLAEHPARWMIWEAPPKPETVHGLRERGLGCVVFYPCGNRPEGSDYLAMMERNLGSLRPVFASP